MSAHKYAAIILLVVPLLSQSCRKEVTRFTSVELPAVLERFSDELPAVPVRLVNSETEYYDEQDQKMVLTLAPLAELLEQKKPATAPRVAAGVDTLLDVKSIRKKRLHYTVDPLAEFLDGSGVTPADYRYYQEHQDEFLLILMGRFRRQAPAFYPEGTTAAGYSDYTDRRLQTFNGMSETDQIKYLRDLKDEILASGFSSELFTRTETADEIVFTVEYFLRKKGEPDSKKMFVLRNRE